jgi:hypothetical protein
MSTMIPDLVVGAVGFGNTGDFYAGPEDASDLIADLRRDIADLEAEVAQLTRHRNRLRRALQNCAALSPAASDEKHEALLETDPKNHENPQENP